MIDYISEEL